MTHGADSTYLSMSVPKQMKCCIFTNTKTQKKQCTQHLAQDRQGIEIKYHNYSRKSFEGFNLRAWALFTISWVQYSQVHAFLYTITGLIFTVSGSTTKTTKIGPLKKFPHYTAL